MVVASRDVANFDPNQESYLNLVNYMDKDTAENDRRYRQVCPYVIFQCTDTGRFLTYRRSPSESRLDGLLSIGVGGHVDEPEGVSDALYREVMEELGVDVEFPPEGMSHPVFKGKIALSGSAVDSVHLGLVYLVQVCVEFTLDRPVKTPLLRPMWMSEDEIMQSEVEAWSIVALSMIFND
jgi:predicted NUDIX family phosphoesterase